MWIPVGENRWDWDADESTHVMELRSGVFGEFHRRFIHRYFAPNPINEEWPLTDTAWIDTTEVAPEDVTDEAEAWQYIDQVLQLPLPEPGP